MKRVIIYTVLVMFLLPQVSWGQQPPPPAAVPAVGQSSQKKFGPKRQATVIIFAGLGGAVLGLSTLSFYGRPQDKLANIAIGAAVGIIVGTIYVTYKAATQPSEFYGEGYKGAFNNPHQLSVGPTEMVTSYKWEF